MKVSRRKVTKAMRNQGEKPSQESKYARKARHRLSVARELSLPLDTPWPVLGKDNR